jgi:hypothetical protein
MLSDYLMIERIIEVNLRVADDADRWQLLQSIDFSWLPCDIGATLGNCEEIAISRSDLSSKSVQRSEMEVKPKVKLS